MKYVKIKDVGVWSDDGKSDDNLYMALDGHVAGMQVGEESEVEWEESAEEGAELEVETAEAEQVEEVGNVGEEGRRLNSPCGVGFGFPAPPLPPTNQPLWGRK